jgi:hypothetical protein
MAPSPALHLLNVFRSAKVRSLFCLIEPFGLGIGLAGLATFGFGAVALSVSIIRAGNKELSTMEALVTLYLNRRLRFVVIHYLNTVNLLHLNRRHAFHPLKSTIQVQRLLYINRGFALGATLRFKYSATVAPGFKRTLKNCEPLKWD